MSRGRSDGEGVSAPDVGLPLNGPIMGAVGFAASAFLRVASWERTIPDVLERLGMAAGVSRVYLFQNERANDGRLFTTRTHEWVAPGAGSQLAKPALHRVPWDGPFRRWSEILGSGAVVHGHVRDFPEDERALLAAQEIRSIVAVPVQVEEDWWGFLGFDECSAEREWSPGEIAALEAAAGTLGSALSRKRTELALQEAEDRYRTLVEQIPAIVYIAESGEGGDWLYISPQVESILGYTPEQWLGHPAPFSAHLHPADRDRVLAEEAYSAATGEPLRSEFRLTAGNGRLVWIRDEAVLIKDPTGRPLVWQGLMHDITDQKEAEEQVAFLAYHDKLTGLPNRTLFEEALDLALARARRADLAVAVLYLDLDNFKLVNDSLGHEAGDQLLQQMGARLRDTVRETDLVARQGGDEFLLLLADLPHGGRGQRHEPGGALIVAEAVASRVHESLELPFAVVSTEFYVSSSVGISLFPFDGESGKALLTNADAAMYRSKRNGPGGYAVFAKDSVDPLTKLSFTTRLRRAVDRKEWLLHYQPILDLRDGHLVSVEGLLRWQEPGGAMVPPGEFIPLAEEMGLIESIGDWVLGEVCRQSLAWRGQGLVVEVSFNLSPRQLWQPNLVKNILSQLARNTVHPNKVLVEITESTAMTDPDRTIRILEEMHAAGLRLAIDDFGTGYSSLSRLKNMPVDILKVDRSFIQGLPDDRVAGSMVRAIIQLAHGLGMVPLAEGIETQDQLQFLIQNDCTLGQGFLFSKPVPAADITQRFVWEMAPCP